MVIHKRYFLINATICTYTPSSFVRLWAHYITYNTQYTTLYVNYYITYNTQYTTLYINYYNDHKDVPL